MHYYRLSSFLLIARTALSASVPTSSWSSDFIQKDSLPAPPNGWERLEATPSPDHLVTLQIGLRQHNFEGLVEELYQVSDPEHARYGQHLSKRYVKVNGAIRFEVLLTCYGYALTARLKRSSNPILIRSRLWTGGFVHILLTWALCLVLPLVTGLP